MGKYRGGSAGWLIYTILGIALVLSAGCSSEKVKRGAVEGSVKANGEPVEMGTILFVSATDGVSAGGEIKAGRYSLSKTDGAAIGKQRVEIRGSRKTGKKLVDKSGKENDEIKEFVPAQYNMSSTLTAEIEGGKNVKDFDLKIP